MYRRRNIVDIYKRTRSTVRRYIRLLFPSPAELRLIELMGGRTYAFTWFRVHGFPLAIVYKQPRLFKAERVKREVRVGSKYVDFGNDIGRGIEVLGSQYHRDVVREFERESYLYQRGWKILYIEASSLYRDSADVQRRVMKFLLY